MIELAPENGEARDLRRRTHLALRHFSQAVEDFRTASLKLPDRADVSYRFAQALEADHKPAEALRAAEQALRLAPDFADARALAQRLAMAVAHARNGRTQSKLATGAAPAIPAR